MFYIPSSVISISIVTSGILLFIAEKNSVYVPVSSVSVIPQATGIPINEHNTGSYVVIH